MNRRTRIQQLAPQDRALWQKRFYRHQQQRLRQRLLAIKAIWDGPTLAHVCRTQPRSRHTLERWVDTYLHGGFKRWLAPAQRRGPPALSATQRRVLRFILLHKPPADYGLDSYQWTARRAQALIAEQWGLPLGRGRLSQLFHQFGLSPQRVHRDYGPYLPAARAAFVAELKKNGPVARRRCIGGAG
jgi:transposase